MSRPILRPRSRAGFTIVELLVVISIIAVLASLLLPAVNGAREASRQATCQNNMRNLGLAVQQYETRFQKFPPGLVDPDRDPAPNGDGYHDLTGEQLTDANDSGFGMLVYVLPFLEQSALYDRIDLRDGDWNLNSSTALVSETISIGGLLYCPSSPRTRQYKIAGTQYSRDVEDLQSTDYAPGYRLNGAQDQTKTYGLNDDFVLNGMKTLLDSGRVSTAKRGPYSTTNPAWLGVMQGFTTWKQANVKTASIRDGLSTTFLLFETAGRPEHHYGGQKDREITTNNSFRWANPQSAIAIDRTCAQGAIINCDNYDEVYSFHPGGANIVNADGSIRLISDQIAPEVFVSLYTMAGGDRVSESALE